MGRSRLLATVALLVLGCSSSPDSSGAGASDGGSDMRAGARAGSAAAGRGSTQGHAGASGTASSHESGSGSTHSGGIGEIYAGGEFHLGPVDWEESQWHNACAPGTKYAPKIRELEGELLAGLWSGIEDVASYCDACIAVTTERGKSAVLRVVTYGETTRNSIDVSPAAYELLDSGEYPRSMEWQFTTCPDSGPVYYELQTGSSEWWTSLWVRNARVPLAKVEVRSANHADYVELERGSDGTLTDGGGFGQGPFSFRLTGRDGSQRVDELDWPAGGVAGKLLEGSGNF